MTFGEARDILRNDMLAEASTDYYDDADLLAFLGRAARELALTFGFPTAVDSVTVNTNDSTFQLPADAANVDLNEVSFGGFNLVLAPYRTILQYVDEVSTGFPRYYNFDPKRADLTVHFAPKAPGAATVRFEYVVDYDTSAVTASDDVWNGLFPAYHELVVMRAAVKAFDASLENERAQYWLQREQQKMQEFSTYLNKLPMHRLIVQEVAES